MWEYEQPGAGDLWCRHHVQLAGDVQTDEGHSLDLNRLHTPTGWVTVEEVIRYLIHELGVQAANADWSRSLAESESKFFREFAHPEDFVVH
jgi:hypothetical protein